MGKFIQVLLIDESHQPTAVIPEFDILSIVQQSLDCRGFSYRGRSS